jgi:hypothetical protein
MKYNLLLIIICFTYQQAISQTGFSLQPEAGAGILFHHFTKDSLVPTSSKGAFNAGVFSYISVLAGYKTKNSRWHFLTGIGYMANSFHMYKEKGINDIIDFFTFAWIWGNSYTSDPYPYNQVSLKNKSIIVPIGFMYNFSKKDYAVIQTLFGLRTNLNFIVNKKAIVSFAAGNVSNTEKMAAEKKFTSLMNPFTLSLMPTVSFKGNQKKKWQWDFTLVPVIFYTDSQAPRLFKPETGFSLSIGATYAF